PVPRKPSRSPMAVAARDRSTSPAATERRLIGSELSCSLSLWERVEARGYGLSQRTASPHPTSPRWGEVSCAARISIRPKNHPALIEQARHRFFRGGAADGLRDQGCDRQRTDIGRLADRLGRLDRVGNDELLQPRGGDACHRAAGENA